MNKESDIQKLWLPVPERLGSMSGMGAGDAVRAEALAKFLESGLKDPAVIESWIQEQNSAIADLPPLPARDRLSPRQKIYDRYFNVCRHGGEASTITFAVGQVAGEISRELQVGSGLDEEEVSRLLDGLAAVLEAAGER